MAAHHKRHLTPEQRQAIIKDRGMTLEAAARKHRISTTTIHRLWKRHAPA